MVRTKTAPRLTSHAAAAAAAAAASGLNLRFNPEINKIVAEGSDEEEQEELVLHLAQGVGVGHQVQHVAAATGRAAKAGVRTVSYYLVLPTMVYVIVLNMLQVINSIWGKWDVFPPNVTYESMYGGLLIPTLQWPGRSVFSDMCTFDEMEAWVLDCGSNAIDQLPPEDFNTMLKCVVSRATHQACEPDVVAFVKRL